MTNNLDIYYKQIAKIPLLTAEQEQKYGRSIQKMMRAMPKARFAPEVKESLKERLNREPSESEWAVGCEMSLERLQKIVALGERARKLLIEANLRLVVYIAKKYQNRDLDLLDLIQEGNIGLVTAVEKFDPERGCRFSTHACWWIFQAITKGIKNKSRTIRLPNHVYESNTKIKRTAAQLSQQGKSVNVQTIAAELKIEPEAVSNNLSLFRSLVYVDRKVGEKKDTYLVDLIEAKNNNGLDSICLREDIDNLLDAELTPKEKEMIVARFSLKDNESKSLDKIAKMFDISRERVRQIEAKALNKLRAKKEELQDYLIA